MLNSSVTGSVAMGVGSRLSSFSATLIILSRFLDTDDGKSILALNKSLIKHFFGGYHFIHLFINLCLYVLYSTVVEFLVDKRASRQTLQYEFFKA